MINSKFKEAMMNELTDTICSVDQKDVTKITEAISRANRIFLTGAGRAGLMMRSMAMRLAQMGLSVSYVGDITTLRIGENDLLIVGSGKAQTETSYYFTNKAKSQKAEVALITANPEGRIAGLADYVLTIVAPVGKNENRPKHKSVQIMGNRFEQSLLLVGDMIVMESMKKMGITEDSMRDRHANLE